MLPGNRCGLGDMWYTKRLKLTRLRRACGVTSGPLSRKEPYFWAMNTRNFLPILLVLSFGPCGLLSIAQELDTLSCALIAHVRA